MDSPARSRRPGCCVPSHSSSGVQGGTATASGWGERGRGLAGHRYHRERELAALRKGWRAPARLLSRQTRKARGRGALPTNSVLISLTSNHHPSHCVTKRRQQRLKLLFFLRNRYLKRKLQFDDRTSEGARFSSGDAVRISSGWRAVEQVPPADTHPAWTGISARLPASPPRAFVRFCPFNL